MEISQQIIEKYLAGEASAEEKRLIDDWYYSFNDDEAQLPPHLEMLRGNIKKTIYARLHQNIHAQRPAAKTIHIKRWAFAAAVLAAVLISGYLFFAPTGKKPVAITQHPPKAVIVPGGNKAVLTLADGSQIVLDSVQNGMIGVQGETKVIKLDNGQLAYKADGTASETAVAYNIVTTPRGGQYQIVLPDGTRAWLNSASSLKFPTVFSGDVRQVILTGEGYFEVQPASVNKGRRAPFVVSIDPSSAGRSMQVTVLGTKFNIMAYDDEEAIKTTLVEGSVAASRKTGKVVIRAGQEAGIKNSDTRFDIADADIREALAWKNGEFRFNELNIKSIMRQLARWYDVDVQYAGNLSGIELSGVIPRKENISELLDVLETTGKVHFKVEGNRITAMPATKN